MEHHTSQRIRIILNGKAAANQSLREAVGQVRDKGFSLEVRVTWEAGDASRFAAEAVNEGFNLVIAAGGDGMVNEVVNGMMLDGEPVQGTSFHFSVLPRCSPCVLPPAAIDQGTQWKFTAG